MSQREDYLSALRSDIVRVLCNNTGAPESIALNVASQIIQAMRLRYQGKDVRFGAARISQEQIREKFNGRNHAQVCRELGISRRTLYRALSKSRRDAEPSPPKPLARPALEGELLLKADWREAGRRYGVGDYVTRDGTDVHLCVELDGDMADMGLFRCVVEPKVYEPGDEPWTRLGEEESNLTRRYSPVDWRPSPIGKPEK